LRRLVIIGTAFAVLAGATAAYAAFFNNYSGSKWIFSPKVAGSKAHPAPIGATEILKASAPAGDRAAPLTNITSTIYGVVSNGGKLPKCTDSMIEANKTLFDKACPKGSYIGGGPVHALLGPSADPSMSSGVNCDTVLHVYNGGPNTQVFFFTNDATHKCGTLTTGSTAPYDGHISHHGLNWTINVPLPPDISNKVAGQPGLYGSLVTETLVFPKSTTVNGKTLHYMDSIACKTGKRPWSIKFTAQNYNGGSETQTVKGSDKC
jgi:hypothetical protein